MLNQLHLMDNQKGIAKLADKSVNLIIADPPYYKIKGDFDFEFKDFDDYLNFMEGQAKLYKRVLADNGSLFVYGHAKNIAYVQVIFDKYFNLENSLVWENTNPHKQQIRYSNDIRSFAPVTERILFYSNEVERSGLEEIKENHIKGKNPFQHVIKQARLKKGLSTIQVAELGKFYGKVNHGGSVANWENSDNNPTEEQFEKLTLDLIETTTRENGLVLIPFAGSGTECVCSMRLKRQWVAFENKKKYFDIASKRIQTEYDKTSLFNSLGRLS